MKRRGPAMGEDLELERLIERRLVKVDALSFGVVCGFLGGLGLFLATNWLLLKGGDPVGPHLALLAEYFPGYRVSFPGSLVGFGWAFAGSFALGCAGAWLYNRVAVARHGRAPGA